MNLPLFSVFAPTTKEAWKQQVIKDLKGKDFDTTLLWETPEGITMPPYYTEEDLTDHRLGELQSVQKKTVGWLNSSTILFENELFTNSKMLALIQQGVDIIQLDLRQVDIHNIEFTRLLNGIKLSQTPIYFQTNNQDTALLRVLQKIIPYQIKGGCTYDGLSQWMQTGESSTTSFEELKERLIQTANSPQFRAICVDSSVFHNAGANAVQELAFTLSAAVTYIDKLTDLDIAFELVLQKLYFSMAVGTHYFMEIAKLRALRYLWAKISKQFEQIPTLAPTPAAFSTCIFAQTSTFYDTVLSPHTNMIQCYY
ncbi:MAG: methylmalonyl-CoA mutase family protein [Spirosomataceae bacterium]